MRIAYFDCYSGISGDMTLGALADAGVDPEALRSAVDQLKLGVTLDFETVHRGGFRANLAKVKAPHEHAHRHLHHIEEILDRSGLPDRQVTLSKAIFLKLGKAEANAHGSDLKKVHFHEVGALDSIVDIVGAAVGIDLLGVDRIEASPVPPGRGSVLAAHGRMPLPAPGTAELLKGIPLAESTGDFEQTTPTGAAILATVASGFGPLPPMTIEAIGLGAGSADPDGVANILRLFVGKATSPAGTDRVWVLETNLDDATGEVVAHATAALLGAGALDVFVTPILAKKGRPAVVVTAIADEEKVSGLEEVLFRETTTLGVRRYPVSRRTMSRRLVTIETAFGPVAGKLGWLEGKTTRFSPEYDACAAIASRRGVPPPRRLRSRARRLASGRPCRRDRPRRRGDRRRFGDDLA